MSPQRLTLKTSTIGPPRLLHTHPYIHEYKNTQTHAHSTQEEKQQQQQQQQKQQQQQLTMRSCINLDTDKFVKAEQRANKFFALLHDDMDFGPNALVNQLQW